MLPMSWINPEMNDPGYSMLDSESRVRRDEPERERDRTFLLRDVI